MRLPAAASTAAGSATNGAQTTTSQVALSAAATHPRTSYYFFRLVDPVKGTHYFSTYFDEHTEVGRNLSTKKAAGY